MNRYRLERSEWWRAYRAAVEGLDEAAWSDFYSESAHWVEHRSGSDTRVLAGRDAIAGFIGAVCSEGIALRLSHEVLGDRRVAYRLLAGLGGGRSVLEHVILELDGEGRIIEQVDIEAWN